MTSNPVEEVKPLSSDEVLERIARLASVPDPQNFDQGDNYRFTYFQFMAARSRLLFAAHLLRTGTVLDEALKVQVLEALRIPL